MLLLYKVICFLSFACSKMLLNHDQLTTLFKNISEKMTFSAAMAHDNKHTKSLKKNELDLGFDITSKITSSNRQKWPLAFYVTSWSFNDLVWLIQAEIMINQCKPGWWFKCYFTRHRISLPFDLSHYYGVHFLIRYLSQFCPIF